jgi:transcriptional regulator GlxA family with amidase domain
MRLVNQIRIEVAQSLLLQTRLTLDAIAAQVGLADASHLSRLFRRLMGRSPGSLRRQS